MSEVSSVRSVRLEYGELHETDRGLCRHLFSRGAPVVANQACG